MAHLFQPFYQVQQNRSRNYGGTGLGLALSRQLCRLLGGDIRVTSEVGRGSVFTVLLPAFIDAAHTADVRLDFAHSAHYGIPDEHRIITTSSLHTTTSISA